jgi:NADH-quinone oxidoreductase subunit H
VVSYEIPLALCVVVPVLIAGTMDLVSIGNMQAGWFTNWFVLHDPFTFVTFFIYATCAIASVNRAPFDLAEAESELVAGFMTEYSGFRWAVFFMAEYGSMVAVSGLAAILFFGGWNGPLPIAHWLGLTPGHDLGIGNFLGMCNFLFKATAGVLVMMWARWTLPRLRIDQVMTTCLKYCVPLGAAMLLGAMLWTYAFPEGLILSSQTLLLEPTAAAPVVAVVGPTGAAPVSDENAGKIPAPPEAAVQEKGP